MTNQYRTIWTSSDDCYRIIEMCDDIDSVDLANLKGDCYNPKVNPDIDPDALKEEEEAFEELVNREGVYGYELQRWNPSPDIGWEHVDSCFGFVGQYEDYSDSQFNHYIVNEMIETAAQDLIRGTK